MYEPDEFDAAGNEHPVGAHRRPEPRWKALLPFILVLIIVPLLAWGAALLISGGSASDTPKKTQEAAPAKTQEKPAKKQTQSPKAKAQPSPTQEGLSDAERKKTSVAVLNVSAKPGYAGKTQEFLKSQGYGEVRADNSQGNGISGNSVYYCESGAKAAGEDVAKHLRISTVKHSDSLCKQYKTTVVVFLFKDFSVPQG